MNTEFQKEIWKSESVGESTGPNSALFADWDASSF